MEHISGVVVPTVTLFQADGSFDTAANAHHMERLIAAGVDALFVLGTTGEAMHLTPQERADIFRWTGDRFRGRVPLLAGVGDTSTATACILTETAEDAGFDAVVALPPFFWTPGERHLYAYFRAIADASRLPVLLYHFPAFTGVDLTVNVVERLAVESPRIAGIKMTLDSATAMKRMAQRLKAIRPDFAVLCGHDDLTLAALNAGLDGVVSSTANVAPDLFVPLFRAWHRSDLPTVHVLMQRIGRLVEIHAADPCGAAVVKAALYLRGWIESPCVRPPALPLDESAMGFVDARLREAGLHPEEPSHA